MTIMLGKIEDSRKIGRPSRRWMDSVREAIGLGLYELWRTTYGGHHSLTGSPGVRADLMAHNTHIR